MTEFPCGLHSRNLLAQPAPRLSSLPVTDFLKNSASHAISSAGGLFFHNPAKQKLKEWGTRKFKKTSHLVPDGPACRIYGSMLVKRVTGNLHITTLGHGYWSFEHTAHKRASSACGALEQGR